MRKLVLVGAGLLVLTGAGVAMAQTPPPPPPGGPEHEGPPPSHERWEMMRHMHHHEDGAAFFRFHRGDAGVAIKCSANETMQACVTAAGTLMDKLGSMQAPKTQ